MGFFNKPITHEPEKTNLEQEIEALEKYIRQMDFTSEDYGRMLGHLDHLYSIKEQAAKATAAEKANDDKGMKISGDTLLIAAAYLGIGTLAIFKEQLLGPIASKAFMMPKMI